VPQGVICRDRGGIGARARAPDDHPQRKFLLSYPD